VGTVSVVVVAGPVVVRLESELSSALEVLVLSIDSSVNDVSINYSTSVLWVEVFAIEVNVSSGNSAETPVGLHGLRAVSLVEVSQLVFFNVVDLRVSPDQHELVLVQGCGKSIEDVLVDVV